MSKEVSELKEQSQETMVRRLALIERALSTYSPSGNERPFAQLIFDELSSLSLRPQFDSAGNVLCFSGPTEDNERSILLCGHMDTVPGELPFRREGDMVYGRGACDAKGPLLSLLFAFEHIALEGTQRVIFAAVTEEERTSAGLKQLLKDNVSASCAIFGEPCGLSKVTIGYRGHLPTTISVETKETHGSAPWLVQNSAELAFSIYNALKAMLSGQQQVDSLQRRDSVDSVSVALTEIHGGTAHNVTPLKTEMTLDIRIPQSSTVKKLEDQVLSIIESYRKDYPEANISADFDDPTEPYKARIDSDLVRAISRAMLKANVPIRPTYIEKSGTGDMNSYARHFGVDAITYGPGNTKLSHTADEAVSIKEIFDCSRVLVSTAREYYAMRSKSPEKA
ncbi:MAG TPA: M20/M25/M40 family metallo-hydrolase [Nitrososphaerales archaeon]|nr:M20/M25/M40 family metallo-hydrolase [Nitrososphaerales archaeon]